jgi:hypothetical protein
MSDEKPARRLAASALRGLVDGVGHEVSDRVRQELGSARATGENPAHIAQRAAAAALGGAVGGVGQNVSALIREEFGTLRADALSSAKTASRGAGYLAGAAAAGNTAGLFVGIAIWRGLGNRIGFAKSALVVAGLAGGVAAVLVNRGTEELAKVRSTPTAPSATPTPQTPPTPGSTIVTVVPPVVPPVTTEG